MAIGYKKVFATILVASALSQASFAAPNYTYVNSTEEFYDASSPVGTFVQYPAGSASVRTSAHVPVNYNVGYYGDPYTLPAVNYTYSEPLPVSYQQIEVPQSYNKRIVSTESYIDQREGIDKAIDRSGKIVGILGFGALLGVGIGAIISAL